ncbi:MAG: T9SS type A sorting domain-containing protein [bacterium]
MMKNLVVTFVLIVALTQANESPAQFSWRALPNAPMRERGRHEDIFFANSKIGWIVNLLGEIYKTEDGGESWRLQWRTGIAAFRSVGFADSLNGWAGALRGFPLYKTNDGGGIWSEVQSLPRPLPGGICGISVVNNSVVYGSGRYDGPPIVIKTTDGGASWKNIDLTPYAGTLVDCHFFSPDSGIVVGGSPGGSDLQTRKAVVLTTADGGMSWQTRYTTTREGEWCWKISFPSHEVGFVSIENLNRMTYCLKTTDRGLSWTEYFVSGSTSVQGIGFATETHGWIGAHGSLVFETIDGGITWQAASDNGAGFGENINRFHMLSDTLGYAVGRTIYKYSRDQATGIHTDDDFFKPESFELEQNYPNPFNPKTTIKFRLQKRGHVTLVIFDISGRQIERLVDKTMSPGSHQVEFDASEFTSGVYLYRLQMGKLGKIRKMTVVK